MILNSNQEQVTVAVKRKMTELSLYKIKELNVNEMNLVSGGGGHQYGTGPGGIFSPSNLASAGRFAKGFGMLSASFTFGFVFGTFLYNSFDRWKYNSP